MNIFTSLFGGSNINVRLVSEDGSVNTYAVEPGTTLGSFLTEKFVGYAPSRYTVKVTRAGVKNEVAAEYVLADGDTVSACIPKNVAGA